MRNLEGRGWRPPQKPRQSLGIGYHAILDVFFRAFFLSSDGRKGENFCFFGHPALRQDGFSNNSHPSYHLTIKNVSQKKIKNCMILLGGCLFFFSFLLEIIVIFGEDVSGG